MDGILWVWKNTQICITPPFSLFSSNLPRLVVAFATNAVHATRQRIGTQLLNAATIDNSKLDNANYHRTVPSRHQPCSPTLSEGETLVPFYFQLDWLYKDPMMEWWNDDNDDDDCSQVLGSVRSGVALWHSFRFHFCYWKTTDKGILMFQNPSVWDWIDSINYQTESNNKHSHSLTHYN